MLHLVEDQPLIDVAILLSGSWVLKPLSARLMTI